MWRLLLDSTTRNETEDNTLLNNHRSLLNDMTTYRQYENFDVRTTMTLST